MEELRNKKIKQLEDKKAAKISEIIELHGTKYKNIKDYYSDITTSNLSLINQFKTEIENNQKLEEADKKTLKKIKE